MQVLRPKDLRRTKEQRTQGDQGQDGPAWAPRPAPRHMVPTHRGTKESVFCSVVGSSSKSEAMSLPWGTATRRYLIFSPAFRRPERPCAPWDKHPNSGRSPPSSGHPRGLLAPAHLPGFHSLPCPPREPCKVQVPWPRSRLGPHHSCCLGVRSITLVAGVLLDKDTRGGRATGHQAIPT